MRNARQRWTKLFCCFCFPAAIVLSSAGFISAQTVAPTIPSEVDVLSAIPADAAAFVAVRNLRELDHDLVTMARAMGFMLGPNGTFPAPLDWLFEVVRVPSPASTTAPSATQPSLADVVDKDGSLALVLLDCREVTAVEGVRGRALYLLPARDGQELIEALGGQSDSEGVATILLMGTPFHAAVKGGYVAAARQPETLRDYLNSTEQGIAQAMAPDRVLAFASHDMTGWVQMDGFSEQIVQEVNDTVTGMMMMFNPAAAMDPSAQQPGPQLQQFITETRGLGFNMTVDARGLQLGFYQAAKPGTELAAQVAAAQPAEGPLLVGLPDEPTILAFGASLGTDPVTKEKQIRQSLDQVFSEQVVGGTLSPAVVTALKDGIVRMYQQAEVINVSLSNVSAEPGAGVVALTKTVKTSDSARCLTDARQMVDTIKEALAAIARSEELPEEDVQAVTQAIQWREGAEQVAGIRVDHLVFDPSVLPDVNEEDLAMLRGLAGPEGILFRIAPVGTAHIVATLGGGPDRLAQVINLVLAGQSPLLEGSLKNLHGQLPAAGRMAEGYLHLDQLITLIMTLGAQTGQPMMMPLMMRNPAPLAFSSNRISETSAESFLLLPTEMVISVREAITPLLGMMMGGGQGGMGTSPGMDMELEDPAGPGGQNN